MTEFAFEAKRYPDEPGCYLMKDVRGRVIYVGKAKRLRRRLASYFHKTDLHPRTRQMVTRVASIEVILVNTEAESLALENNLIKRYRPRFNRQLMADDSGYHYICLTDEAWPRLVPYRKNRINKVLGDAPVARRFGPYRTRVYRDALLSYVADGFGLRTCEPLSGRPCLRYHLGRCSGVCVARVTEDEYGALVAGAVTFLGQPHEALVAAMRAEVNASAERLEYERAQHISLQVKALEATLEPQVVERDVGHDQDVLCFGDAGALVMQIHGGAVMGLVFHRALPALGGGRPDVAEFVRAMYGDAPSVELIVDQGAALSLVADRAGGRGRLAETAPRVTVPRPGTPEAELLALCERNYHYRASHEP